jgi:hypothetical protein
MGCTFEKNDEVEDAVDISPMKRPLLQLNAVLPSSQ